MRAIGFIVGWWLVAGTAWGQTRELRELHAPKIDLGSEMLRVPMGFRGGRVVVEARVNDKGPYSFYFDTGASGPVISQALADELKLPIMGEAGVKSGGDAADQKPIPAHVVRINQLQLGPAQLSDIHIVSMNRIQLEGQHAPVGVLSPAMFPGYLVTLDYPKKEIRIRSGKLGNPDNKTIFAYQEGRPIPSVMAAIGDQTIEAHLDSGSGEGLSLPTKVAEKLTLEGKPVNTGKKARSVRGDFPVFEGKLKGKLSFGQFSFDDPAINFSDVILRGNLGARILQRFVLTVDVKNRRFQMTERA
jgi:hypothetical protein